MVNEAEEYGLPVLAVTAVGKELAKRDARYLSLSCRIAAEFGAHMVKTYYCDDFQKVVNSCPVPIIVAGGPKIPERDALELTYNSIRAGAAGVDMGRNIWQSQYPVAMMRAVRAIVHSNYNLDQAYKLFQQLAKGQPPQQKDHKLRGLFGEEWQTWGPRTPAMFPTRLHWRANEDAEWDAKQSLIRNGELVYTVFEIAAAVLLWFRAAA